MQFGIDYGAMTIFAMEVLRRGDLRPVVWLLSQPLFWAALGVVGGPYLFLRGFQALQLKRQIMNVPRSTIRGAALGPVELSGKAVGPYTLVAPMTKVECLCYWLVAESNSLGPLSSASDKMWAPLYLDDGTGTLMIWPEGVSVRLHPAAKGPVQEYVVKPGEPIFIFGTLCENPWSRKNPSTESSELSRIGPGFVSEDEADMLWHEAFPLLDPTLPAGPAIDSTRQFDLHPPNILTKGNGPLLNLDGEPARGLVETKR